MTGRRDDIEELVRKVEAWCRSSERIRAAAVIGSYARVDRPADDMSDLDVLVVADGARALLEDERWPHSLGDVLLTFIESNAVRETSERRILFTSGVDADFTIVDRQMLEKLVTRAGDGVARLFEPSPFAVLRRGIRFLVDRDGFAAVAQTLVPDADAAGPTQRELDHTVADYWYHALWTRRKLARGELWVAAACCNCYLTKLLLRVVEWESRLASGVDTWHAGRFLETWAAPEVVERLEHVLTEYDQASVVEALAAMDDLFAALARAIADRGSLRYDAVAEHAVRRLMTSTSVR